MADSDIRLIAFLCSSEDVSGETTGAELLT